MVARRWKDLAPEPGIVAALEHAGDRSDDEVSTKKGGWSSRFADGCAVAIADAFRAHRIGKLKAKDGGPRYRILPVSLAEGTEPVTPLGATKTKRIDVTLVSPVLGLEIGVSLKGMNSRDGGSGNFDKNVTGRLYEMGDEMQLVHEHLPHAFMVGIFFIPVDGAMDKTRSSFAHTVVKLRARTTRLDTTMAAHAARCDAAFVALYATGNDEISLPAGVTRFFDVADMPPKRGRPKVETTLNLSELVDQIVTMKQGEAIVDENEWVEPEQDDPDDFDLKS